jgi:hypothetical protein
MILDSVGTEYGPTVQPQPPPFPAAPTGRTDWHALQSPDTALFQECRADFDPYQCEEFACAKLHIILAQEDGTVWTE